MSDWKKPYIYRLVGLDLKTEGGGFAVNALLSYDHRDVPAMEYERLTVRSVEDAVAVTEKFLRGVPLMDWVHNYR